MHTSPQSGHNGLTKTYNKIKQYYFWENLKEDIRKRIHFCLNCQLKKLVRVKTKNEMQITDTPGTVFEKVSLDIFGPLPVTENNNQYILTMQDQLSKFCLACALPEASSESIADSFIQKCICTFGSPRIILTDQGKNFISSLIKRVAKRFKIKPIQTTAYHPASNGSLERTYLILSDYLKQYVDGEKNWDLYVDLAMFSYNTSVHEGTNYTPYELVFGKLARLPSGEPLTEGEKLPTYQNYLVDLVKRLIRIQKLAHDNLIKSKEKSKKYYDRNSNVQEFKLGSSVFLQKGPKPGKLENRYTVSHKVLQIFDNKNVKIITEKGTKIVHPNRLKHSHINP